MAAKGGKEHHNVVALREAKAKVLEFVKQGLDLQDAISRADRKPDVMKDWRKDEQFMRALDKARSEGEKTLSIVTGDAKFKICLLYTSPSPRDGLLSRMPSSA